MDKLIDTSILKFNQTTLYEVRKEMNLHQAGALDQIIAHFEEWISKQNHFKKKKFDRHYLETSIILAKGSLERAKNTLDKLCTLKTLLPQFFSKYDVKSDFADTSGFMFQTTMPKLLKDNYRLYVVKMVSSDFDPAMLFDFHRYAILMSEYVKRNDYCHGFVCLLDCSDINLMSMVTKINILDLRDCMSVLMQGYGMRIKGIHIITTSKAVDLLVTLLKQVISEKIIDRIKVHKNVDTLYEFIPKEVLPKEYGGDENPLKTIYDNWVEELSIKENVAFFKDILGAGTDEKYRLTSNYNYQILGMPGSFRTLTVD